MPAVLTPVGPNGQYTVTYSTPFLGRFSAHLSASDGLTTTTVLPIFNVVSTPPPPPQPPITRIFCGTLTSMESKSQPTLAIRKNIMPTIMS